MDSATLRILDVSLNRAREALRVIEDYARFALDDHSVAAECKRLRHSIREIVNAFGVDALLDARDIAADVGRDTKTAGELRRSDMDDVVQAAFARLGEATRSISEYGKVISADAACLVEAVRYAAYELEQRVVLRGELRRRFRSVRLYVLVTEAQCGGPWRDTADAALRGGAGCLQLREKSLPDAKLLSRARELKELCARYGALCIINDRPDIARLAGADGVHVGQDDLSVNEVRKIAGARLLVGKSTHTVAQIDAAIAQRPDYIAVGPMFASVTQPQDHIAGAVTLSEAARRTDLPLVAIGGITAENAAFIMRAGASCVCVSAAVVGSADVRAAAERILTVVPRGRDAK